MLRFAVIALALTACATDPVTEPDLELDPTLLPEIVDEASGTLQPEAPQAVRNLTVSCAQRLDGVEQLGVQVESDRRVAFAFVQLRNGELGESFELNTIDFGEDGILVGGRPEHVNEAVSLGNLLLEAGSPVSCATLPEFGVHVTIAFETGAVACITGGNATQATSFVCQ